MGARWHSYANWLPVNRAMPFWLPIPDKREIPPFTLAHALGSGWMWQIPTQNRIGCRYVYSDSHIGPDEARREVESILGNPIDPAPTSEFVPADSTTPGSATV